MSCEKFTDNGKKGYALYLCKYIGMNGNVCNKRCKSEYCTVHKKSVKNGIEYKKCNVCDKIIRSKVGICPTHSSLYNVVYRQLINPSTKV
jgi:hypothetical protein